jgi:hypothetical protein
MPCAFWATTGATYWWILPLIGLVFMGLMFFVCIRHGFGCVGGRSRISGHVSGLQRDLESVKDDIRKLQEDPS